MSAPDGRRGWRRGVAVGGGLLGLALLAVAAMRHRTPPPQLPTVVLITVDTLRADAVSFEDPDGATPFLASLAREGVVFRQAYAPSSWTVPSMASLFTSLAPPSHGVVRDLAIRRQPVLSASFTTLAETLQQAGYVTIGVPTNPHLGAQLGFAQGFDYYAAPKVRPADRTRTELLEQVRQAFGDQPFETAATPPAFVWVHYMDPHAPYTPHEPWATECARQVLPDGEPLEPIKASELTGQVQDLSSPFTRRARCLYESEVRFVDAELRLLNDALGLDRDTVLLIITADHGEELADHRRFGHARTLYEEVVRVPLLIRWPRTLVAGRVDAPVNLLDVYPTIVALLGRPLPAELQGRSLVPLLRARTTDSQTQFYQLTAGRSQLSAVRDGTWKLIRGPGRRTQLFDLRDDPREQMNQAEAQTEVVARLGAAYDRYATALPQPPAGESVDLPSDAREELRQLGYGDR